LHQKGKGDLNKQLETKDEELEELKKQFIVDSKKFEFNKMKDYLTVLTKYCKISPEGKVFIEVKKLSKIDTITLVILARYIGNKVNKSIPAIISPDELSEMTGIVKNSITGHVTTLGQRGLIVKPKDGIYQFNHSKIDEFLLKLNTKINKG